MDKGYNNGYNIYNEEVLFDSSEYIRNRVDILLSQLKQQQQLINKKNLNFAHHQMSMSQVTYYNNLILQSAQSHYYSYLQPYVLLNQCMGSPQSDSLMHHYQPKNNIVKSKVKTSLCKKFSETGNCPYGYKCQFAHGIQQLRCNVDQNSYKTKPCIAFCKRGYCQYGNRCNFSHKNEKTVPSEMDQKKKLVNIVGYQEIIKEGLIGKYGGSRIIKNIQQNIEIIDEKSQGSTIDCFSQGTSVISCYNVYFQKNLEDSQEENIQSSRIQEPFNYNYSSFYDYSKMEMPSEQEASMEKDENFQLQKQVPFINQL